MDYGSHIRYNDASNYVHVGKSAHSTAKYAEVRFSPLLLDTTHSPFSLSTCLHYEIMQILY